MSPTSLAGPEPPGQQVALMVTRRCNMTCEHCSVESGPGIRDEPTEAELLDRVRQAAAAGVRSIRLTGGEPMQRKTVILRLIRECRRMGVATSIVTNGFWGRNFPRARGQLRALQRAGLGSVTVSYDRYHAAFQSPTPVLHIARAADELGVPLNINLVRSTDESELSDVILRLEESRKTSIRVYDLQPVGRARDLPVASHRSEAEGFCSACASPALTDDGRLIACNGPAYFEHPSSPLVLGSLRETPFAELLERHRRDPVLDTIRTRGPAGLRDELRQIPGFESFPFRSRYPGICALCHHVTRSPEAVEALRVRLDRPDARAARLAVWQVIDGNRRHGTLGAPYVNGIGACRVFFGAIRKPGGSVGPEAERVLGRADLDWRRVADYLGRCGLARPLLASLDDPGLTRWAPGFFRDEIRRWGMKDGLREAVQREGLRMIGDALSELGARGVLLKGTALLPRLPDVVRRASADVDVLVDAEVAPVLRAHLRARGFAGPDTTGPKRFQHLTPIAFEGVPVEIHTRILPAFWGLPEREMLESVWPLPGSSVLAAPRPEAFLLHLGFHSASHSFSCGLKTAWDLLTVLQNSPDVDWDRIAAWAAASRTPRGFWSPIRVLAGELDLPVPASFLAHAPSDDTARRVDAMARRRLFSSGDSDIGLAKAGLMLLLQETWLGRAHYFRHFTKELHWYGGRRRTWSRGDWTRRTERMRHAWRQYLRYRQGVATAMSVPPDEIR